MKHFTFSLKMLLLSLFVVGGVNSAWADSYTITFKTGSGDGTAISTTTACSAIVSEGSSYLNGNVVTATKVYSEGSDGLKLGASSNAGKIKMNLANSITPTSIVVSAKLYNSSKAATLKVNGSTAQSISSDFSDLTFSITSEISYIELESSKYCWIKSITVNYASSDDRTAVNMTGFTAEATTLVKDNTTTTTVTNDQSGWTAAYTYSSDNTSVATVDAEGVITAVAKGTANITATLNVSATDANYKAGSTKSKTIEITVTNPFHTASFSVNGTVTTADVEEGEAITFPENPADIYGKAFVGWVSEEIAGTQETAPTFVSSANMSESDVTYYAVFATSVTGSVTDELTNATTGVGTSTSYSNWSGKTASSSAVYAGNSAGTNSTIQLRTNNSNSGVVSTISGGKVTKVVVDWSSDTQSDRTLDIYGKNTAYEKASDLYGDSQGTKLGSIDYGTTELEITGNYAYIGVRSKSGALYMNKLSITWISTVYSAYCTTIAAPSVTISDAKYATFVPNTNVGFSGTGVTAYVVSAVGTDDVTLTEVESVPANTPVVVKAAAAGTYPLTLAESATDPATNYLLVSDGTVTGGDNIFALAKKDGEVGFYAVSSTVTIPAGKCYINSSSAVKARLSFNFEGDDATAITAIEATEAVNNGVIYNLSGQRVVKPLKGIYIQNGKKIFVK